jgi:polyhydroxybutyrate depolymerase
MQKNCFLFCLAITALIIILSCNDSQVMDIKPVIIPLVDNKTDVNQIDSFYPGGIKRTYLLHVPSSYSYKKRTSLVIALHGYSGNALDFAADTKFSEKSDTEGFIVVYPNGLPIPQYDNGPQAWNAGGSYEEWTGGADDVGVIRQFIDLICQHYSIDSSRIFIAGHSNGAMMAYRLGFELSDKIAAIAPHSGQMVYTPAGKMNFPVHVIHLHGLNDYNVNYYGSNDSNNMVYDAVDIVLGRWSAQFSGNTLPDTIYSSPAYIIKEWKNDGNGPVIQLYLSDSAGHYWFTKENSGISATQVIWDFFKSHPKK